MSSRNPSESMTRREFLSLGLGALTTGFLLGYDAKSAKRASAPSKPQTAATLPCTPTAPNCRQGLAPLDRCPDCFRADNVVNIHYHGLHVGQDTHADNAMLALYPKGQQGVMVQEGYVHIGDFRYQFQVPP